MPTNKAQRVIFALLSVIFTVHGYVFYSLYVVNGTTLMEINNETSVLRAINAQGGVYMIGTYLPIWACILIEFCFAFLLENVLGSPASFKLACKVFDPRKNHPMIFETAIICATVGIMCPAMSFIAAWLYYPYYAGFNMLTLLANWVKLVCFNFPFAYFSQLFFIQPLVRTLFKALYHKQIKAREAAQAAAAAEGKETAKPSDETEAIADVYRRVDEIKAELDAEKKLRAELQSRLGQ